MLKNKKLSALVAIALTFALLVPFTATAHNAGNQNSNNSTASDVKNQDSKNCTSSGLLNQDPQVAANREKIAQNNVEIIALKQQSKALVGKICTDLAGTKGIESITSSQNYKDVVTLLKSLNNTLCNAEKHDYISGLRTVKGKMGHNCVTSLDNVIAIQVQKIADLKTAIINLNAAVIKADAIAALKPAATDASNTYKVQAAQKKLTIDQNNAKISTAFAENKAVISQIIATASANKAVLLTKPTDVAAIETKLAAITKSLKGTYNGNVANCGNKFNADKKNKDYTNMLADLDKIISAQQTRITTLAATKVQLQDILSQLNTLIG
jgi:hypothetical protein